MTAPTDATTLDLRGDGIAICTLQRPALGNALSPAIVQGVLQALEQACGTPGIHTFVLRGTGRHFCTGFDLSTLEQESDASLLARFVGIETLLNAVWRAPLRTVALAQGAVVGAGADLFAACDHRMLSPNAKLRFPGASFGIVLGTRRLGARVGSARALRLVSEGLLLDAKQAIADGLATALIEPPAMPTGQASEEAAAIEAALSMLAPLTVSAQTFAALRAALDDGGADADLSALVRSAAVPGLKQRISAYVQGATKLRSPSAGESAAPAALSPRTS